jgi:Tol biopolymer transport system component
VTAGNVVFESIRTGDSEIWAMTPEGLGQRNLTNSPATEDSTPALSPDGRLVAFVRGRNSGNRLWVMNADGTGQRLLVRRSLTALNPVWSPDGDEIAFARRVRGNWDIYIATLDGETRRLTSDPAREIDASWSPAGNRLVFSRATRRSSDLWSISRHGGPPRNLTRTPDVSELNPAWSPRGDEIAYDAFARRQFDLFALNISTRDVRRITHDRADDGDPDYDPTGTSLAYRREVGPDYEIAVVDATGAGAPRNATREPSGLDLAPSWGPEPTGGAAVWAASRQVGGPLFTCDHDWPGTPHIDHYGGNGHTNHMCGAAADDVLQGYDGTDWLNGHGGNDELRGGDGNDGLKARDNAWDSVWGGKGNDIAFLDAKDYPHDIERPRY